MRWIAKPAKPANEEGIETSQDTSGQTPPGLARDARASASTNTLPKMHLRFSERRLLLALMDLVAMNLALAASLAARADSDPLRWEQISTGIGDRLLWFALLSGLWLVVASLLDAYDLARAANSTSSIWTACSAAIITTLVYFLIPYITPSFPIRRLEALTFPLLASLFVGLWRLFYAKVFVQPIFRQHALVVGAGWAGRTLAEAVAEAGDNKGDLYRGTGYRILGFVDDDPAKQGQTVADIPILGTHRDLVHLVRRLKPDEIAIAITDAQSIHDDLFQSILDCREMGIQITTMSSLYERLTGRVPVEHAGRDLNVVVPVVQGASHRIYLAASRLLDIVIGGLGCAGVVLLSPVIWIANQLSSPGSLFFHQERVGQGGRVFHVVKFRSMVVNAEENTGVVWATEDDSRVTPMGRLLRKTRLDESPQFLNVVRGDMGLIGPRPERPEFVTELAQQIPFYRVRHAVRPGITGWAQVKYGYGASVSDALVKLQYDLYYIKHQGPYLDLLILLKTMQVMFGLKGR